MIPVATTWPIFAFWRVCTVLMALSCVFPAFAQEETRDKETAIAFALRLVGDGERVRLLVDFDKTTSHDVYLLDEPRRMIVDLGQTVFTIGDRAESLPELISDYRAGTIAPARSRIVLELAADATVKDVSFKPVEDSKRHRLIVDLVASDREAFAEQVKRDSERRSVSEAGRGQVAYKGDRIERADAEQENIFTVVLDPGHGGIDGGAVGKGRTVEKVVTLKFAEALRDALQDQPGLRVVMTRDDDTFVSLEDRVNIARRQKAGLLISIHADSLRQSRIRGATIYTLSKKGSDELAQQLAEKQNRTDLIAGLDLPKLEEDATDILIDLTRRETGVFSRRVAAQLLSALQPKVKLIKNPKRSADFFVLRAPEIPSVLLELGYLSNRRDEKLMASPKWRSQTARLVADAVVAFFQPRLESKPAD